MKKNGTGEKNKLQFESFVQQQAIEMCEYVMAPFLERMREGFISGTEGHAILAIFIIRMLQMFLDCTNKTFEEESDKNYIENIMNEFKKGIKDTWSNSTGEEL